MRRGLLAEYDSAADLLAALRRLRELGYRKLDAFTPYPVKGVSELIGLRRSIVPKIVLGMALCGGAGAYGLQWWMNAYDYPIDVGGRPPHSALAFVPITFEMTVLAAGLTAFITVFVLARLTTLDHPIFDVPGFERASIDRFWLGIDAGDEKFGAARADLVDTRPLQTAEVGP